jgi:hypothetical protein
MIGMSRRARRWILAAIVTATTTALTWLPAAAQAGITATGAD